MEVYFNGCKYDSMKKLQEDYLKWIKIDGEKFTLIIKKNNHILFEGEFTKNESENNIFEYIHKELMKKIIELKEENLDLEMLSTEYELDLIDGLYVMYFNEINETTIPVIFEDVNSFVECISDDERLMMSEKCALYDIENNLSEGGFDGLVKEYMNLSMVELVEEYESKYNEDYHLKYLEKIQRNYNDQIVNKTIISSKTMYKGLKQYYIQNDISLEMRKK